MNSAKKRPWAKPLRDAKRFAKVYVEHGALSWPGGIDLAPEAIYALVHKLPLATTFERAKQNELTVSLAELRKLAGKTQVEVAAAADMAQSEISKLEHRDDFMLSTLRRYVEALGGNVEVVARLGDKSVVIRGV